MLVHACVRMNGSGCVGRTFIHDPLDSVSKAASDKASCTQNTTFYARRGEA